MVIKSLVFKQRCVTCSWWAPSGAATQQSTSLTRLVFQPLPYYCNMSGRGRGPPSQRRNGDEMAALAQISIMKGQLKDLQEAREDLVDWVQLLEAQYPAYIPNRRWPNWWVIWCGMSWPKYDRSWKFILCRRVPANQRHCQHWWLQKLWGSKKRREESWKPNQHISPQRTLAFSITYLSLTFSSAPGSPGLTCGREESDSLMYRVLWFPKWQELSWKVDWKSLAPPFKQNAPNLLSVWCSSGWRSWSTMSLPNTGRS